MSQVKGTNQNLKKKKKEKNLTNSSACDKMCKSKDR